MYTQAGQKFSTLSRILAFIDLNKRQVLFRSSFKSQYSYCPLTWMFCLRKSNNFISKIHERSLRIVAIDKRATLKVC